nr:MAG: hypothetical protein [Apis mellifera filamentous virus]
MFKPVTTSKPTVNQSKPGSKTLRFEWSTISRNTFNSAIKRNDPVSCSSTAY